MWNSDSGPISIWDVKMPSVNFFQLYNIQSTTLLPLQCLYVHFVFCAHNCIFFLQVVVGCFGKTPSANNNFSVGAKTPI